jgi:hypothetical protein
MPKQSDVLAGGHRKAPPYRNFWQEAAISGHFWLVLPVTKTKKGYQNPSQSGPALVHTARTRRLSPRDAFSGSLLERKIGAAAALAHPRFVKELSPKARNGLSRGGAAR